MRGKETGGKEGGRGEGDIKNDKERRHMERKREKGGKGTRRRETRGKKRFRERGGRKTIKRDERE